MSLSRDYLYDRARSASRQELLESDSKLMADLEAVLTLEMTKQGVHIDFGGDRELFQTALDALGINNALEKHPDLVHIHQVMLFHGSTSAFLGKAIPAIRKLSLLEGLDTLHADFWKIHKQHDLYSRIHPWDDHATSKIQLDSSLHTKEGVEADPDKPAIIVGAAYRYLPEFTDPQGYQSETSLAKFIERGTTQPHNGDSITWKLGEYLGYSGLQLAMPSRKYFLRVGDIVPYDVNVKYENHFELKGNRVQLKPITSTD